MSTEPNAKLMELMVKNSRDAGHYKGLLEAILVQLTPCASFPGVYAIDKEVIKKIKKLIEQ